MQTEAGKPSKQELNEDAPSQEPMKGSKPGVRRNPSTDQIKVRHQLQRQSGLQACAACSSPSDGLCGTCGCTLVSTAAVVPTSARMLRKGDVIRLDNGQQVTLKHNPRPHETSGQHWYLDTNIGTRLTHQDDQFNVLRGGGLDVRQTQPWMNPSSNKEPGNFNYGRDSLRQVRRQGDPNAVRVPNDADQYGPRGYRSVPIHMSKYHTLGGVSVIASRAQTLAKEEN